MLSHHVLAFGNADDDNPGLGPERKFGGTDQIPDILNQDQLEALQIDLPQSLPHQIGIEMATVDRSDLNDWDALRNEVRIAAGCRIAVEDRNTNAVFELRHHPSDQRGL